tara:strand:- start:2257 stop:2976 length:720 start_codon:yes stop_codon:yes gene_type:complete
MSFPVGLLFKGGNSREWNWRLSFFIAVAVLAHITAFYFFQVVYPETERISVQPMRVVILDPSQPDTAQLLRELEDRAFSYGPGTPTELSQYSLANSGVSFRPSFQNHEISLRPVDGAAKMGVSTLLAPGKMDLPPRPESKWTGYQGEKPQSGELQVRLGPKLASRNLDVDNAALSKALRQPNGRLRAQAGVKADGRLLYLLVSEEPEGGLSEAETQILRNVLRFEAGEALQQDWIEIIW